MNRLATLTALLLPGCDPHRTLIRRCGLLTTSALGGLLLFTAPVQAADPAATALPGGGSVSSGAASISQSAGKMVITQSSDKAVLLWKSFDIGSQAEVQFLQPSAAAVALNRIAGADASQIQGKLSANGQVILINPNGIVFGGGSQVNVGGIIASTQDLSDADFQAGKLKFQRNGATGAVVNKGTITAAEGGLVGLIGASVTNTGMIRARLGRVVLAAGEAVALDIGGDGKLVALVDPATVRAEITQGGIIQAEGGQIVMTAKAANALLGGVINLGGLTSASSLDAKGGSVTLKASDSITLTAATVEAKGATGGGSVTVGDWNTGKVTIDKASTVDASATGKGKGGSVAVFADQTVVKGTLKAKGGAQGGDGGKVETSGHTIDFKDVSVSTLAPQGKAGTWLIDPYTVTIDNATVATLISGLNNGSVVIQTQATASSGPGTINSSGVGDIVIAAPVTWSANTTLTLDAYHSVLINAAMSASGTTAAMIIRTNSAGTDGVLTATRGVSLTGTGASLTINSVGYTLVSTEAALIALMATSGSKGRVAGNYYALNADLALSASALSQIGAGLGNTGDSNSFPNGFASTLEGMGHTITNLTLSSTGVNKSGLFSQIAATGTIRNLTISGGSVTLNNSASVTAGNASNYAGLLAGENYGTVYNVSTTGTVSGGTNGLGAGLGGLVGVNHGTIDSSSSTAAIQNGNSTMGGLAGVNDGTISNSWASGTVSAGSSNGLYLGGLVGSNQGKITGSSAFGSVTTGALGGYAGGLVGSNSGTIDQTFSQAASVTAGNNAMYLGGLVGYNSGAVTQSWTQTAVTGGTNATYLGGLTGQTGGTGSIANSYATGAITGGAGSHWVGGLAGALNGTATVATSYSTGAVNSGTGGYLTGGLIGTKASGATVTSSYWNTTTSGQTTSAGLASGAGAGTGLTTTQMQSSANFTGFDFSTAKIWGNASSTMTPYIKALVKTVSYQIDSSSVVYGDKISTGAITYRGIPAAVTLTPTIQLVSSSNSTSTLSNSLVLPVGTYTSKITALAGVPSVYYTLASTANNNNGTVVITQRPLSWSVADKAWTYGDTGLSLGKATMSGPGGATGVLASDVPYVTATVGMFSGSTQVSVAQTTPVGTYTERVTALSGSSASNYYLSGTSNTTGTVTVSPKTLTWSVADLGLTSGSTLTTGAVSLPGVLTVDKGNVSGVVSVYTAGGTVVPSGSVVSTGTYSQVATGLTGTASSNYVLKTCSASGTGCVFGTLTVQ